MRESFPDSADRSFDVLFELEGHPVPTFVARSMAVPQSGRGRSPGHDVSELVVVERHFVSGESRESLLRVGRKLERFRHPNVVPVKEMLDTIGVITVVSQYIDGELLSSFDAAAEATSGIVALSVKVRVLLDILEGLEAIHALGDPAADVSLFTGIDPLRAVVGMDGTTRLVHLQRPLPKRAGSELDRFLPPEALVVGQDARARDLYGVGVMLWEALSGGRFDPVLPAVRFRPREIWAGALVDIANRATASDPSARYASANELRNAIREAARNGVAGNEAVATALRQACGAHMASRRARLAEACSAPPDSTPSSMREASFFAEEPVTSPSTIIPRWPPEDPTKPGTTSVPALACPPEAPAPAFTPTDHAARTAPVPPPRPVPPPSSRAAAESSPPPLPRPSSSESTGVSLPPTSVTNPILATPPLPIPAISARPPDGHVSDVIYSAPPPAGRARARSRATFILSGGAVVAIAAFLVARQYRGPQKDVPTPPAAAAVMGASSGAMNAAASVPTPAPTCAEGMIAHRGGTILMSDDGEGGSRKKQSHHVTVPPFCIDAMEVTVARFKKCSDNGECKRAHSTNDWLGITPADRQAFDPACTMTDPVKFAERPVTCVDWERADIYCKAKGGHLPTEAQWELAARGTDGRIYPWGAEAPSSSLLNACGKECGAWAAKNHLELPMLHDVDDGWPLTSPVGAFPQGATPEGVHDLAGNVSEWTADWFGPYPAVDQADPQGPSSGEARVVRGGAWSSAYAARLTTTYRSRELPAKRSYNLGFRCAAPLPTK